MDFLAIDFETPNKRNDSICAMGITLVIDSKIDSCELILINPHSQFDEENIRIHGITRSDVKDAPDFQDVWYEYELYFRHYPIVAHNAAFDRAVLQKTAKRNGIELPKMDFYDTMNLYKENFSFSSYGLEFLCNYHGIELKHHDAGEDSLAAAKLMILLSKNGSTFILQWTAANQSRQYLKNQKMSFIVYVLPPRKTLFSRNAAMRTMLNCTFLIMFSALPEKFPVSAAGMHRTISSSMEAMSLPLYPEGPII